MRCPGKRSKDGLELKFNTKSSSFIKRNTPRNSSRLKTQLLRKQK